MNEQLQEKRNVLLGLAAGTVAVCAAIWYFLIRAEYQAIDAARETRAQVVAKIGVARKNAQLAEQMEMELAQNMERLEALEEGMAEGDVYLWIINRLLQYREPFGIEFLEFDPPQVGEVDVLPKVPYKAARFAVSGTGTYFGFGEFLAEFENQFPTMRIRRLDLEPAAGYLETSPEPRLAFKMEFTMLVRTPENRLLEREPAEGR